LIEQELASDEFRKEQEELQAIMKSIIGKHITPKRLSKKRRREINRKLEGISVSQMIIESR
jgi:hypothetical protein